MRLIGHVENESQAGRLASLLYSRGINSRTEPAGDGRWEIWVIDDDNVETAKTLFEQFRRRPDDPMFDEPAREGARQKRHDEQEQRPKRSRTVDASAIFYKPPVRAGILSIILIGIAVAVTLLTNFGKNDQLVRIFSITEYRIEGGHIYYSTLLSELRRGQIWRLFTPIFVHFGILHLLFDGLWMWDLGSMIEARRSSWKLLILTLVLAGTSNVAQYLQSGPSFGGLSGVVYGLLGYIWMQGKFNPASGLALHPQTVTMMIVWFFLCLTGVIGHVANTAHAVGLAVGIVWGYLSAQLAIWGRHH
jgi:GlpG protein